MKTITFRTLTQALLFEDEIKGQISDGMWENSSGTCWQTWCDAIPVVGDDVGRDFHVGKTGFALERLVPIVGDRMVKYAKIALAFSHVGDLHELRLLEYAGQQSMLASIDCTKGFWLTVVETIARHGGHEAVLAALNNVEYTEKNLRAELREMKKAMKTQKES